jgi:propanol-preferring alcohol dehydrogenase
VGLSRSAASLQLARECGADLVLNSNEHGIAQQVVEFTGGTGAACVFECVGNATSMRLAAQCAATRGQIVVIGEEPDFPAINTIEIAQRELEIIGSRNGSKQDAADALTWMAQGVIKPPIVKRVSLPQINEGMSAVREGTAHGRVVVTIAE